MFHLLQQELWCTSLCANWLIAFYTGPTGTVFAVEFSHRSGRDLINMATHRTNVIPIIEDARHPLRYRMLVSMVDVIFADVAQPDQARIVGLVRKTRHNTYTLELG